MTTAHSPWTLQFATGPDGFILHHGRSYSINTGPDPDGRHAIWCHGMCPHVAGRAASWAQAVRAIRHHANSSDRATQRCADHARAYGLQAQLRATEPGFAFDPDRRAAALAFIAAHAMHCWTCAAWERAAGRPVPGAATAPPRLRSATA